MRGKQESEAGSSSASSLLAKELYEWRTAHGLVLKQVAARFGVAEATWSRWEKGSRFPSAENLRSLADFIGVPVCRFFYPAKKDYPCCPSSQNTGGKDLIASCDAEKSKPERSAE